MKLLLTTILISAFGCSSNQACNADDEKCLKKNQEMMRRHFERSNIGHR